MTPLLRSTASDSARRAYLLWPAGEQRATRHYALTTTGRPPCGFREVRQTRRLRRAVTRLSTDAERATRRACAWLRTSLSTLAIRVTKSRVAKRRVGGA